MRFLNENRPRTSLIVVQLLITYMFAGLLGIGLWTQLGSWWPGALAFFGISVLYTFGIWNYWISVDEIIVEENRITIVRRGLMIEKEIGDIEYYVPLASKLGLRAGIGIRIDRSRLFIPQNMGGFAIIRSFIDENTVTKAKG